jgi:hypothetical protein
MQADELSATVVGLVLEGKLKATQVPNGSLVGQWSKAIELIKANPDALQDKSKADSLLAQCLLSDEITTAHEVASRHNGLGEEGVFGWVESANNATKLYAFGRILERNAKKALTNDPVDLSKLYQEVGDLLAGKLSGAKPANQIDYLKYKPYDKSGIPWMDSIIGGWATDGIITVVAPQGTGKSFFQFYTTCMWLLAHPDSTAVIYTLEMSDRHYLSRSLEMYPQFVELIQSGRLYISSSVRNVDDLVAEVHTTKHGFVGVDDLSKLAGESSPDKYERVLTRLNEIARLREIPVQVLAQPTREAKKSKKFIDIYDGGWSSAIENSAAMYLTLNRVAYADPEWTDTRFVPVETDNPQKTDRFYICFWKFRDNRPPEMQQGLGAIRIEPDKHTGRYKQIWVGDALGNRLWPVTYHRPQTLGTSNTPQSAKPVVKFNKRDN